MVLEMIPNAGFNNRASALCPEYSGKAHLCSMEIIKGTRSNSALKKTRQRCQTKRKQDWKNKRLHGQFIGDTEDIADRKSWN